MKKNMPTPLSACYVQADVEVETLSYTAGLHNANGAGPEHTVRGRIAAARNLHHDAFCCVPRGEVPCILLSGPVTLLCSCTFTNTCKERAFPSRYKKGSREDQNSALTTPCERGRCDKSRRQRHQAQSHQHNERLESHGREGGDRI